ncbi:MAG: DNA recombination protein RmuC [Pseudomonadota bacterium]
MEEYLSWIALSVAVLNFILLVVVIIKLQANKTEVIASIVREEFRASRKESAEDSQRLREEVIKAQKLTSESIVNTISKMAKIQFQGLRIIENRIKNLVESNDGRLDKLRDTVDRQMSSLQQSNEQKLDQMRQTVDEKLQHTLEKRLGESFKLVSDRLEAVQRGLGDMQHLATGVGDLKRMLTNVKARGTWGEFQIGDILEQVLTVDQFKKNVQPKADSNDTVEYAIRLPGQGSIPNIWLPIDSKFPQEDYQRLIDAAEISDINAVEKAQAGLIRSIKNSASEIADKYIDPPYTTDFAILFLPTEGLYSEVLRQPGLIDTLQQKYRVVVAGPTTLAAILNSLRMGFRTLAIEKHSSEVWNVLSAVKTEFSKFGDILSKVKKQLDSASSTIEKTGVRTRVMEKKLRDVEDLPMEQATKVLGLDMVDEK